MGILGKLFGDRSRSSRDQVWEISAADLKAGLDAGEPVVLLDVREQWEWDGGHLDGALHVPLADLPSHLGELDRNADVVVYCHRGHRSWYAAAYMLEQGFTTVASLAGGIESWQYVQHLP